MNMQSNAMPGSFDSQRAAPTTMTPTRPLYWSVRRELWENRSIYLAPLIAAGVVLFGFLISLRFLPMKMRAAALFDPMLQHEFIQKPYHLASFLIMGAAFIVAIFYCLDALHSERRDRSILFWKSLPVSDLTTVLAKATVPLVILPLLAFAITVVTQWIMLLLSSLVLAGSGPNLAMLWSELPLFPLSVMLLYHLVTVHVLWYAPIYAWFLLVSGWARRATFLWAVLPPLAICVIEKIAFNTSYFATWLGSRFIGGTDGASYAAASMSMDPMAQFHLGRFLINPELWIGLALAAAFLAAAVRLRRYQGPI